MKEQALIDEQVRQVQNHPGNINSNLGENLPFKEKLETIVENSSSIHSEFDVTLNGICDVIRKINNYISRMEGIKIDSRKIRGANLDTQIYPDSKRIHVNEVNVNPQVQRGVGNLILGNVGQSEKLVGHISNSNQSKTKINHNHNNHKQKNHKRH
jgi:hypothetical protein